MTEEIPSERIEVYLEDYPNLYTAIQKQNWYSYTEALEDLTSLINEIVKASLVKK
jgi:hypothetical protein